MLSDPPKAIMVVAWIGLGVAALLFIAAIFSGKPSKPTSKTIVEIVVGLASGFFEHWR